MSNAIRLSLLLPFFLSALSCASTQKLLGGGDPIAIPPKGPPETKSEVFKNNLKNGLSSLKGRKIGALVVFNLPDGYMIRAKNQINPPDFALKQVMDLQEDRAAWFDEALVVQCDKCADVETVPPLQILPERLLLRIIDRVSLRQPLSEKDWQDIGAAWPDRDVIWLILGTEDYEQKRGPAKEKGLIASWSESLVSVRGYLRDMKSKKTLHEAAVVGRDEDLILYQTANEPESGLPVRANVAPFRAEDLSSWEPSGSMYDSPKYDEVYAYPPVPESPLIIRKALLSLTETTSP